MSRVITGTKALKQARRGTVHKATGGNVTKVRCQTCGTLAHPVPTRTGSTVLKCKNCGKEYGARAL